VVGSLDKLKLLLDQREGFAIVNASYMVYLFYRFFIFLFKLVSPQQDAL
jgi:hypothetical protein